jgi:hypothetical protein
MPRSKPRSFSSATALPPATTAATRLSPSARVSVALKLRQVIKEPFDGFELGDGSDNAIALPGSGNRPDEPGLPSGIVSAVFPGTKVPA